MSCKIPMNTRVTISVMLLCEFVYTETFSWFWGVILGGGVEEFSAVKNCTKIIGKHVCNFIKKWLQHGCFPAKSSKTLIL